jgi:hypothetical protein
MRALLFVALVSILPACPGCCAERGPCLSWVKIGETYSVELVQQYRSAHAADPNALFPFERYDREQTCGSGLDLDIGSVVRMKAVGINGMGPGLCSCKHVQAQAQLPGVKVIRPQPVGLSVGDFLLLDQEEVSISGGCHAGVSIGIMPVISPFTTGQSDEWVATDYMLFRTLTSADDSPACLRPGSTLPINTTDHTCWDSWAVRIRDSSGKLISRDTPRRPGQITGPDAGASTDGGLRADGGASSEGGP